MGLPAVGWEKVVWGGLGWDEDEDGGSSAATAWGGTVPEFSRHLGARSPDNDGADSPCLSCSRDEQEGRRRGR